jgi:hypothetical protein
MNENNPNDQWTNSETKQVACIIENNLIPLDFWDYTKTEQERILSDIVGNFDLPYVPDTDIDWEEVWSYLHNTFLKSRYETNASALLMPYSDNEESKSDNE